MYEQIVFISQCQGFTNKAKEEEGAKKKRRCDEGRKSKLSNEECV